MKSTKYIIILLALIGSSSCEKIIDMKISEYPSKLVINAQLNPDSLIYGNISRSIAILDDLGSPYVSIADVNLYENDSLIETLKVNLQGFFRSNFLKPKPGKNYKIEAVAPDFPMISGESLIPENVLNYSIDTITEMRNRSNSESNKRFVITLNLQDQPNIDNYFIISFTSDYAYRIYNFDPMNSDIKPLDSIGHDTTVIYPFNVETNIPIIEMSNQYGSEDDFNIVDQTGGAGFGFTNNQDNYLSSSQFTFSDITFKDKKISIDFEADTYLSKDTVVLKVSLRSVSKDYYTYLKSMAFYRDSEGPFTEKVQVFTNIKNGYGILGSENKVEKKIVRIGNAQDNYWKY